MSARHPQHAPRTSARPESNLPPGKPPSASAQAIESASPGSAAVPWTGGAGDLSSHFELRVLSGPQAGAAVRWPAGGQTWTLSVHRDDGDTPLEDEATGHEPQATGLQLHGDTPVRLRLTLRSTGLAWCDVLEGQVAVGGDCRGPGQGFDWSPGVAMELGDCLAIAFGDPAVSIWSLSPPAPQESEAAPVETSNDEPAAVLAAPRSGLDAWLAGGGAVLGGAGLVWALGFTMPTAPSAAMAPALSPAQQQALLQDADFSGLRIELDGAGRPQFVGRVASRAQAERMRSRLTAWPGAPRWQVQVDEVLAANVEEALQLAGLSWRAVVTGPGEVRLEGNTAGLPAERIDRAMADVRAALPQLRQLIAPAATVAAARPAPAAASATESARPVSPSLPATGGEPGKRIVTLVSQGPLPHLVTADGARYFVGAVLPSGHRVAEVQPQALLLERDGAQTRIDF
ncbi:hypothetical protein LZ017_16995 [Pelomonas sp. CA6]|uniref:SctD/MshK family protein n=1 Tax=Pelomonas sp. CA6 TaxID=2907999 RepID=UPI001F4C056B|nr:hypothetical protein [Pelomonas sp. CA6]MCH7345082.1 hypothetical protein [Pelomonas sp. CA6]